MMGGDGCTLQWTDVVEMKILPLAEPCFFEVSLDLLGKRKRSIRGT